MLKNGKILAEKAIMCNDTKYKDPKCIAEIDDVLETISNNMLKSYKESIGSKSANICQENNKKSRSSDASKSRKGSDSKSIPGWNAIVKPFRETASFWHAIWTSCGKLRHG